MVRLCSKSSRPYSGRPATRARQQWRGRRSAMAVVREQESAEAIVPGVTSRKTAPDGLTTREGLNLAGRHDHRWSCPGAMRPNRLSCGQRSSWQRKSAASFRKDCQEPPYADPHVRWCGSREGQNPPGDPIRHLDHILLFRFPYHSAYLNMDVVFLQSGSTYQA